jgi:hypothetical protein
LAQALPLARFSSLMATVPKKKPQKKSSAALISRPPPNQALREAFNTLYERLAILGVFYFLLLVISSARR